MNFTKGKLLDLINEIAGYKINRNCSISIHWWWAIRKKIKENNLTYNCIKNNKISVKISLIKEVKDLYPEKL